jgi:hypothetical protein
MGEGLVKGRRRATAEPGTNAEHPTGRRFTIDPAKVPAVVSIGREVGDRVTRACDVRRTDSGEVVVENIVDLREWERLELQAHFKRALTAETGGRVGGALVSVEQTEIPGSRDHFHAATYALPPSFRRITSA